MKSKKKEKSSYSSKELSIEPTPKLCGCGNTEHKDGHCDGSHKQPNSKATKMVKDSIPLDAEFVDPPKPRKMIIRKEVQANIDIDKRIKYLIGTGHYNLQQIAGMWSSVSLERVKEIYTKMKQDV